MNQDNYGEIINGEDTYHTIANKLKLGIPVLIGWTDEAMSHYDILFTNGAYKQNGNINQMGLRADDIFVSVMGKGSFGFYKNTDETSAEYIAEKLNINGTATTEKLAELINNVKKELIELNQKGKSKEEVLYQIIINNPHLPVVFFAETQDCQFDWTMYESFSSYIGTVWYDENHDDKCYTDFDEIFADYAENYLVDNDDFKNLDDEEYDDVVRDYVKEHVVHYKAIIVELYY